MKINSEMQRYDKLAELLFNWKNDTFPWNEVNKDLDIIFALDQSIEIGGVPHAMLIVSDDLMEACKRKFEQELDVSWFKTWQKVKSFIYKILRHFEGKATFLLERSFFPFLLADIRLVNLPFDTEILQLTDNKVYHKVLQYALISSIFRLSISHEYKFRLLEQCMADKFLNWARPLFEQSKVNDIEASIFSEYLIGCQESDDRDEILRITLSGIASSNPKGHYELLKSVLNKQETRLLAISALSYCDSGDEDFLLEVVDLLEANLTTQPNERAQMTRFYFSLLASLRNGCQVFNRCHQAILNFCDESDQLILDAILENVSLELQPESVVYEFLLRILDNESHNRDYYKPEEYGINRFDEILSNGRAKPLSFLRFLNKFVIKTGMNFQEQIFYNSLNRQFSKDNRQNRQFIIDCLVDDLGRVRFLGNVLLERYMEIFPKTSFKKELLILNEDRKVILIFSIRYYLPFKFVEKFKLLLIPIISIQDEVVKIMLVKIIVSMMRDFPSIISILEGSFGSDESWKETLDLLKGYRDQVSNLAWEKISVQELSPSITHSHLYGIHQKIYTRRFKDDITQSAWEKSILSKIASKVFLLKGGGWKIGSSEEQNVQKLGQYETSITVPTYIYRNPEKDQLQLSHYFSVDFESDNELKGWLTRFLYENI